MKNRSLLKTILSSITTIRFKGIMIEVVSRADLFQLNCSLSLTKSFGLHWGTECESVTILFEASV